MVEDDISPPPSPPSQSIRIPCWAPCLVAGRHHISQDKDGRYLIDVDGDDFAPILNFLRFNKISSPEKALDILEYAEYFGLTELKTTLSDYMPVKAIALYEKVRQQTPNYAILLRNINEQLSFESMKTSSVMIVVEKSNSDCREAKKYEQRYRDGCQMVCLMAPGMVRYPGAATQFTSHHGLFDVMDYWQIKVAIEDGNVDLAAVANTLVHDLKAFGAHPADDVIYKPDARCYCTVARKVKLTD